MRIMPIINIGTNGRYKCHPVYKGGIQSVQKSAYENLLDKGFVLFQKVTLKNPENEIIEGYTFIKDTKNKEVISLITDNDYNELGHVAADLGLNRRFFRGVWCTGKNLTETNPEFVYDYVKPYTDKVKTSKKGKYKGVVTEGFNSLIKYIKEHYPRVEYLNLNAKSQQSWDFCLKFGFKNVLSNEYNPNATINKMTLKIGENKKKIFI